MIEVKNIKCYDQEAKVCTAELYADSIDDFSPVDENEDPIEPTIYKLPLGYSLDKGSTCYTSTLDLGVLNSSGVWVWNGEVEEGE